VNRSVGHLESINLRQPPFVIKILSTSQWLAPGDTGTVIA
jgi:hypothetical protein